LKLGGKRCLVVGGGAVACRKVESLVECEARVEVIAYELVETLKSMINRGLVSYQPGGYHSSLLSGTTLVVAATNDPAVNHQVAEDCRSRGILVNVVDDPAYCDFYVPSVVQRGDLSISISTNGKSPLLARRLRERLEREFDEAYGHLVDYLGLAREKAQARGLNEEQQRAVYTKLLDSKLLELLRQGNFNAAEELVAECISSL